MWIYEKKLQYPVKIATPNPRLAGIIISALGGPDGELAASMRYLNQRYTMPDGRVVATLTDVGSEELGHMEMVASIIYQLTKNLTDDEIRAGGFDKYYVDHGTGIYPASASGVPFNAMAIASKSDALASIHEDLAAEQKARAMYDNILRLSDDPDVNDAIKFLRQREVVHFQRFGEAMRILQGD
ncbi:MAG: manganese catalase family protein [Clostridia bacterium]|nr:manganese catalase family protein [Clostridia bacterium]MBP3582791.1 manganese catalase family protein [Clostridia bacterium]